jgi:isopentenyl-diphosphate delta-isomerase
MVVLGAMRRLLQRVSAQSLQEAALAERCIVVNERDLVIGDASKEECHRVQPDGRLILHRAFRFRSKIVMNVGLLGCYVE